MRGCHKTTADIGGRLEERLGDYQGKQDQTMTDAGAKPVNKAALTRDPSLVAWCPSSVPDSPPAYLGMKLGKRLSPQVDQR